MYCARMSVCVSVCEAGGRARGSARLATDNIRVRYRFYVRTYVEHVHARRYKLWST